MLWPSWVWLTVALPLGTLLPSCDNAWARLLDEERHVIHVPLLWLQNANQLRVY